MAYWTHFTVIRFHSRFWTLHCWPSGLIGRHATFYCDKGLRTTICVPNSEHKLLSWVWELFVSITCIFVKYPTTQDIHLVIFYYILNALVVFYKWNKKRRNPYYCQWNFYLNLVDFGTIYINSTQSHNKKLDFGNIIVHNISPERTSLI